MCEQVGQLQGGHGEPEYFEEAGGESRNFQEAWRRITTNLSAVFLVQHQASSVDQKTRTAISHARKAGSCPYPVASRSRVTCMVAEHMGGAWYCT